MSCYRAGNQNTLPLTARKIGAAGGDVVRIAVCKGGDEIAARSPFWVAVDYMVKAKNADPTLEEEANKMIVQYRQYFPEKSEAFMYNLTDGQSYRVSCGGMSATTTVRTQSK